MRNPARCCSNSVAIRAYHFALGNFSEQVGPRCPEPTGNVEQFHGPWQMVKMQRRRMAPVAAICAACGQLQRISASPCTYSSMRLIRPVVNLLGGGDSSLCRIRVLWKPARYASPSRFARQHASILAAPVDSSGPRSLSPGVHGDWPAHSADRTSRGDVFIRESMRRFRLVIGHRLVHSFGVQGRSVTSVSVPFILPRIIRGS